MSNKRTILNISDLHVGSVWGLFPQDYKFNSGNTIELNPMQEELLSHWKQMKKDVGEYDTVFLLGDIINGKDRKDYGKYSITTNLVDQKNAALKLLKPICKDKKVISISGSNYHGSDDYEIDREIALALGGDFAGVIADYKIDGTNIVVNIAHGKGVGSRLITSKMNAQLLESLLAERLKKLPTSNIILRAHWHTCSFVFVHEKWFILNPAWEGPRYNMYTLGNYFRYQPDIGVTKIEIEDNEVKIKKYLYPLNTTLSNIKCV